MTGRGGGAVAVLPGGHGDNHWISSCVSFTFRFGRTALPYCVPCSGRPPHRVTILFHLVTLLPHFAPPYSPTPPPSTNPARAVPRGRRAVPRQVDRYDASGREEVR